MKILLYSSKSPWRSSDAFLILPSDDQPSICRSTPLCWRFFLDRSNVNIAPLMMVASQYSRELKQLPNNFTHPWNKLLASPQKHQGMGILYPMSSMYEDRIFKGGFQGRMEGDSMLLTFSPLALKVVGESWRNWPCVLGALVALAWLAYSRPVKFCSTAIKVARSYRSRHSPLSRYPLSLGKLSCPEPLP